MKKTMVKSDGKVYHLTVKNETRPVLGPTEIPSYGRRFRGRIALKSDGETTWENDQNEVGIQGFRPVRIRFNAETGMAQVESY